MTKFKKIVPAFLILLPLMLSSFAAQSDLLATTFYHNDALGSPVAATDDAGAVLWREEYRPYGDKIINDPSAEENTRWYTGHPHDQETGLTYAGARYYDPVVGRFMGIDPVGFTETNPMMFNRYAYANNNPYLYVDPDGGYADLAIEAISIGIGVASFVNNVRGGNYGAAALDAGGVALDTLFAVVPGLPGAAGLAIKAAREGGEATVKVVAKGAPQTLVERGADLVKRNGGKNRVSISTPNGRTNIDLAGKSHNVNGVDVPTPHVQDFKNNLIPSGSRTGQVGSRSKLGDTRPATAQDLRTVDRFLKSKGRQ